MRIHSSFEETFAGWLQFVGECWEWLGAVNKKRGTGVLCRSKDSGGSGASETKRLWTTEAPHRLAYRLGVGPIPKGCIVLHKDECGNPLCCRPDHLELGSRSERIVVQLAKKRHRRCTGRRGGRRRGLSGEQVREVLGLLERGDSVASIAEHFEVSNRAIYDVAARKTKASKHYGTRRRKKPMLLKWE